VYCNQLFVCIQSCQPQLSVAFVSTHPSRERLKHPSTSLPMVFDFFKKRATEGIDQISKLTDAASRGELARGLTEAAAYTSEVNRAFASGLAKSRAKLLNDIDNMVNNEGRDVLEDLETLLLQSDLGVATTEDIMKEVTSLRLDGERFFSKQDLMAILRGKLLEALRFNENDSKINFASPNATDPKEKLSVLLFMGANGMGKTQQFILVFFPSFLLILLIFCFTLFLSLSGKTTTIGKLAHRLRTEGNQKVLLAACDTFRAGAVDQLQLWAERAEVECFIPSETAKVPSAVLYGALDYALKEEFDTLIVDTSGRLSNNDALTAQLAKMKRIIQKRLSIENEEVDGKISPKPNQGVPHETLLVIDAAQGRMALDSALQWNKEIGLTGLILTKLDGSARGGSVVAVSRELQLPVKLVGVGETINDLKDVSITIQKRYTIRSVLWYCTNPS
jgi:fused signal recognition particle receptor